MKIRSLALAVFICALSFLGAGCGTAPGKPKPGPKVPRPGQVLGFATLYKQNCAACHGEAGRDGAAISLANPVYLAVAGVKQIERITAAGVPGTMMPPFGKGAGGLLTDQQIQIIAQGMVTNWGNTKELDGTALPTYASNSPANPSQGQKTFAAFCGRCHGADGTGITTGKIMRTGSLVEPAYLALVSNQGLRSIIIAGQLQQGMPDWHSETAAAHVMTDQEITDTVAWLALHRIPLPGQIYRRHQ